MYDIKCVIRVYTYRSSKDIEITLEDYVRFNNHYLEEFDNCNCTLDTDYDIFPGSYRFYNTYYYKNCIITLIEIVAKENNYLE